MKLSKAPHKAFLYQRLNYQDGQPRQYTLDKLDQAMSVVKKLVKDAKQEESQLRFADTEINFTPEEWVFLKEEVEAVKSVNLIEGELLNQLKEIFDASSK